jgi:hypothetical protein
MRGLFDSAWALHDLLCFALRQRGECQALHFLSNPPGVRQTVDHVILPLLAQLKCRHLSTAIIKVGVRSMLTNIVVVLNSM